MRALSYLLLLLLAAGTAAGDTFTLVGTLNNPADPRIIGPGPNGAGAVFDPFDPGASINNVVLFFFTLAGPANVQFTAPGADATYIDPYLSVFSGSDGSATFLSSALGMAFGDPIDVALNLGAGDYVVALSAFWNMSFAENLGAGTLGDGFIGLGNYSGGTAYDLTIDTGVAPIPEPTHLVALAVGLSVLVARYEANRSKRRS